MAAGWAAGAAALPAVSRIALAQNYPTQPITIIVPFPAGAPLDILARVFGARMRAALGQSVIVENVTGAAGTLGVGRVVLGVVYLIAVTGAACFMRNPPDGYRPPGWTPTAAQQRQMLVGTADVHR